MSANFDVFLFIGVVFLSAHLLLRRNLRLQSRRRTSTQKILARKR
jgi:hypothetical protein